MMIEKGQNKLLECTLRDGSYAINFQFTPRDTALLAMGLEHAGIDLIEIGHGLGLNAANCGKGEAAACDEEYMKAVAARLSRASWGMFCIPGIARLEDIDLAADYGMDFIRIGTNAPHASEGEPFIRYAKSKGLFVAANLMKSYVLSPEDLARQAAVCRNAGADMIYLVDSAGCLFPEDVCRYLEAFAAELPGVPMGFHGHDNLYLAVANAMAAFESGASLVDTTLQGLGRGGGNASTEALSLILHRKGKGEVLDPYLLMDIAESQIRPLLHEQGKDSFDIIAGYAGFHSSHLKTVMLAAEAHDVDPRKLVVELCKRDKVDAPPELADKLAEQLSAGREQKPVGSSDFKIEDLGSGTEAESLDELIRHIHSMAHKSGKMSVLNVVGTNGRDEASGHSPFVQCHFDYIIGSVTVANAEEAIGVAENADGRVDMFFVDCDPKEHMPSSPLQTMREAISRSLLLGYSDYDVWMRSVREQAVNNFSDDLGHCCIVVSNPMSKALAQHLAIRLQTLVITGSPTGSKEGDAHSGLGLTDFRGLPVTLEEVPVSAARNAALVVCFDAEKAGISLPMVNAMAKGGVVLDAGLGGLSSEVMEACRNRDIRVLRPDMRAALAAEIRLACNARHLSRKVQGTSVIAGCTVVSGGLVGQPGDIVVDILPNPTRVVGVANGHGGVAYRPQGEDAQRVRLVEKHLNQAVLDN